MATKTCICSHCGEVLVLPIERNYYAPIIHQWYCNVDCYKAHLEQQDRQDDLFDDVPPRERGVPE